MPRPENRRQNERSGRTRFETNGSLSIVGGVSAVTAGVGIRLKTANQARDKAVIERITMYEVTTDNAFPHGFMIYLTFYFPFTDK